jgi:tetratricopeptide (TPR) repeat protein
MKSLKPQRNMPLTAQTAYERAMAALHPDVSVKQPKLRDAVLLVRSGQLEAAAQRTQAFLRQHPDDTDALSLLGELARRAQRYAQAELLFARCVELAPEDRIPRFHHANALLETGRPEAALAHAEILLTLEPANPVFRALKAMALELVEEIDAAALLWQAIVQEPAPAECWIRYGNVLRALGRRDEAIAAYRHAVARQPSFGLGWWALAQLNTFRFEESHIAKMDTEAQRSDIPAASRIPLLFALGKAHDQRNQYEKAFGFYARGNALQRLEVHHDPKVLTDYVARCKRVLTPDFFRARDGAGCASREPIFLIGMLRSGSTLVEQILASHSQVEGTRELFNLAALAQRLQIDAAGGGNAYPTLLGAIDSTACAELGNRYLETARLHRKLGRPRFIDKMGKNFAHLGLLHLILPNAKIVDVRRHPLACCFSNFTQLYANGQDETYRFADLAQLYRDYVELMDHFDRVLPGRVYRVFYEELVADPETEIRRLLGYLELPFERSCLEFHRNARAVSTISSEQVRQPMYTGAREHWRHYEPWLGPLTTALGPIAEAYPDVPPAAGSAV